MRDHGEYEALMERRNVFVVAMGHIESILRTYRLYGDGDAQTQAERDAIAVLKVMDDAFAQEEKLANG